FLEIDRRRIHEGADGRLAEGPGASATASVEAVAHRETGVLVSRLWVEAFVAGPAEVGWWVGGWCGDAVEFFPVVPADVAEPDLVGAGAEGEAAGVGAAVAADAAGGG